MSTAPGFIGGTARSLGRGGLVRRYTIRTSETLSTFLLRYCIDLIHFTSPQYTPLAAPGRRLETRVDRAVKYLQGISLVIFLPGCCAACHTAVAILRFVGTKACDLLTVTPVLPCSSRLCRWALGRGRSGNDEAGHAPSVGVPRQFSPPLRFRCRATTGAPWKRCRWTRPSREESYEARGRSCPAVPRRDEDQGELCA